MFKILMGELEPDEGTVKWGVSTSQSYLPKDNTEYFDGCQTLCSTGSASIPPKKDDVYLRGFLGRMLFSGEDVFKPVKVLSGGEKVRCMLSKHDALRRQLWSCWTSRRTIWTWNPSRRVNKGLWPSPAMSC